MKKTAAALVLMILSVMAPAHADQATPDRAPFIYRILRRIAFDFDRQLEESLNIRVIDCTFKHSASGKISHFHGLGPCLYRNFVASFGVTGKPGEIHTRMAPVGVENAVPVEATVEWNPAELSFPQFFINAFYIWRGREPTDGRAANLLGVTVLRFEPAVETGRLIGRKAKLIVDPRNGAVTEIALAVRPLPRQEGWVFRLAGEIYVSQKQSVFPTAAYGFVSVFDLPSLKNERDFELEMWGKR